MEARININVSATDYEKSSDGIRSILTNLEEIVHEEDCFGVLRCGLVGALGLQYDCGDGRRPQHGRRQHRRHGRGRKELSSILIDNR